VTEPNLTAEEKSAVATALALWIEDYEQDGNIVPRGIAVGDFYEAARKFGIDLRHGESCECKECQDKRKGSPE
jgi:hypothetical protein